MRSQASVWAVCVSLEMKGSRMLKGFSAWKAVPPVAPRRVEGGPAGWVADGTLKEDGPETWETPVRPVGGTGRRRTGDSLRRAAGSKRTGGRPLAKCHGRRTNACPTGKARPRGDRRRADAAGESDGRIGARMVGNGLGTRTQRSKGGQC